MQRAEAFPVCSQGAAAGLLAAKLQIHCRLFLVQPRIAEWSEPHLDPGQERSRPAERDLLAPSSDWLIVGLRDEQRVTEVAEPESLIVVLHRWRHLLVRSNLKSVPAMDWPR